MAIPRKRLFDPSKPVTCHCVSRCVRRSRLLDPEWRRRMLLERLVTLVRFFAVDVLEWAFLGNHFHVVLATHPDLAALWSDREVAARYRTLSPDYELRRQLAIDRSLPAQPAEIDAALANPALVARWRRDLGSVSAFHKFLKQKLAALINFEDDVTGHCWEGRFKSVVALDEEAVIAHMVYVALNPVRAGIAKALDEYEFASIADRIEHLKARIRAGEFAVEAEAARERLQSLSLLPALPCDPGPAVGGIAALPNGLTNPWIGGRIPPVVEGASLAAFLASVDASGRVRREGKRGAIDPSTPPVLAALDAELAAFAAAAASPRFLRAAREVADSVEAAMSRGLANVWGNFSGGAAALARHARETGRRFVVAIAGRAEDGNRRRIAAEPEPPPATDVSVPMNC